MGSMRAELNPSNTKELYIVRPCASGDTFCSSNPMQAIDMLTSITEPSVDLCDVVVVRVDMFSEEKRRRRDNLGRLLVSMEAGSRTFPAGLVGLWTGCLA